MDEYPPGVAEAPKNIVCRQKEGMFQIFLHRPPMNAFTAEMVEEINRTLNDLMYRRDLNVVVFLTGGKNFCGGVSPEDLTDDRSYQLMEALGRMYELLQTLNIPVMSIVQGIALGAGFELVMLSDLAIAAESSTFGLPDIKLGLIPAFACNILQKCVPPKKAAELIFTGEMLTAREAEKYGLINQAVPDDKLTEQAGVFVRKLLQFSAPVLQLAKKAMTEAQAKSMSDGMRSIEEIYLNELLSLNDSKEGVKAFAERRQPKWKNE